MKGQMTLSAAKRNSGKCGIQRAEWRRSSQETGNCQLCEMLLMGQGRRGLRIGFSA